MKIICTNEYRFSFAGWKKNRYMNKYVCDSTQLHTRRAIEFSMAGNVFIGLKYIDTDTEIERKKEIGK